MAGVSELSVVTRVGVALLKGVAAKKAGTPEWPNIHGALMELHEILREWEEAAKETYELVFELREITPEEIKESLKFTNVAIYPLLDRGWLERHEKDIQRILDAKPRILQRLSRAKWRRSARMTLRSMMQIYCPDLLSDFEAAITERSAWVRANRREIRNQVKAGQPFTLGDAIGQQAMQSAAHIATVRTEVAGIILDRYPMGN